MTIYKNCYQTVRQRSCSMHGPEFCSCIQDKLNRFLQRKIGIGLFGTTSGSTACNLVLACSVRTDNLGTLGFFPSIPRVQCCCLLYTAAPRLIVDQNQDGTASSSFPQVVCRGQTQGNCCHLQVTDRIIPLFGFRHLRATADHTIQSLYWAPRR